MHSPGSLRDDVRDALFMHRALELAERGWGRVHPNPLVGAVVVREGVVVGEGWHAEFGGPHAEVVALERAGSRARGSTLYVTLEPCTHHGKTPPCTDAVQRAGIARVVFAAEDPHPAAGGGSAHLRAAGIEVRGGVAREEARRQNAIFFHALEHARPFVALKYALSLDARLSERAGARTRVTGDEAEHEVHRLRAGFDAVLVGAGTARADDPLLTVRAAEAPRTPPIRIVADSGAALSTGSRMLAHRGEAPVWLLAADDAPAAHVDALEAAGARVLRVPRAPAGIDLDAALGALWDAGVRSVLCEGGGRLGSALLAADVVERLYLFYAARFFGAEGTPAFVGVPESAPGAWQVSEMRQLGSDLLVQVERAGR